MASFNGISCKHSAIAQCNECTLAITGYTFLENTDYRELLEVLLRYASYMVENEGIVRLEHALVSCGHTIEFRRSPQAHPASFGFDYSEGHAARIFSNEVSLISAKWLLAKDRKTPDYEHQAALLTAVYATYQMSSMIIVINLLIEELEPKSRGIVERKKGMCLKNSSEPCGDCSVSIMDNEVLDTISYKGLLECVTHYLDALHTGKNARLSNFYRVCDDTLEMHTDEDYRDSTAYTKYPGLKFINEFQDLHFRWTLVKERPKSEIAFSESLLNMAANATDDKCCLITDLQTAIKVYLFT